MHGDISSNYCLLVCSFAIILFSACSNDSKNKVIFRSLDESLVSSSQNVARSNEMIYASFKEKLLDPATSIKAGIWHPKVLLIQKLAVDMVKYIENLKKNIKKNKSLSADKVKELYNKLLKYKTDLLNLDPKMTAAFESVLITTTKSFDSSQKDEKDFAETFFSDISTEGAMSLLSMFQYNVVNIENKMILFCHNQPSGYPYHEWVNVLSGLNSSYVQAGEKIEVTTGVGYFSNRFKPEIIINGKKINLDASVLATHWFTASRKPGKHFIPVEVTYTDQEGKQQRISKTLEYTVVKGLDE